MKEQTERAFEFVKKNIETCVHVDHIHSVDNLIELYYILVKDDEKRDELIFLREHKYNEIHTILS